MNQFEHSMKAYPLIITVASFAIAAGCRSETKAKEVARAPADTMLMHDLAEANKNTATAAATDNSLTTMRTAGDSLTPLTSSVNTPVTRINTPPADTVVRDSRPRMSAPIGASDATGRTTIPVSRSPANSVSTRASRDPCDSPTDTDQRYCLNRSIVANDADLNQTYQELIAQARKSGGSDLEERFRQSQREWINQRDADCRSAGDGSLWARERARCLAAASNRRTAELQRNLNGLRGQ
jgi:uncharacterized protein YecT (DUF1311 family)